MTTAAAADGLGEWKARQAAVWGSAPWERWAGILSGIHDRLVASLEPRPGERWLDLATGTGAVAIRAARAGADVTAQDLAPALIRTAKRLAAAEGLRISFDVGDAEALPYADASFDVVSSAHGIVFAARHAAVARELARVCRPGGRLGLTYWRPDGDPERARLMAPLGSARPTEADSPADWGRPEYARALLGDAFELEFVGTSTELAARSGEVICDRLLSSQGPAKQAFESLDPKRRHELRRAWLRYLEGHRKDGGVSVRRDYLLILGRRRRGSAGR